MEEITLWEINTEMIHACEGALYEALKELGLKRTIIVNSEPPLISRNELWGRLPVLEIEGWYWSLYPGKPFTKGQLLRLFEKIMIPRSETDSSRKETAPCQMKA